MSFDYLGAISDDSSDYDHGERLVTLMYNQYVNLGSPVDFQAQATALWQAYNDAKVGLFGSKWNSATKMKNIGVEAHRLLLDMQRVYPDKMRITIPPATLTGSPTTPTALPVTTSTPTPSSHSPTPTSSPTATTTVPSAQQIQNITPKQYDISQVSPVVIVGGVGALGVITYLISRAVR